MNELKFKLNAIYVKRIITYLLTIKHTSISKVLNRIECHKSWFYRRSPAKHEQFLFATVQFRLVNARMFIINTKIAVADAVH